MSGDDTIVTIPQRKRTAVSAVLMNEKVPKGKGMEIVFCQSPLCYELVTVLLFLYFL